MRTPLPLALVFALSACPGAPGGDPDAGPVDSDAGFDDDAGPGDGDAGPVDPDALVGAFALTLVAPTDNTPGFTQLVGRVSDGPTPAAVLFEEESRDGDCALLVPRIPFCQVPCGSAVCIEDDVCLAFPSGHSVGTVTVSGVRTTTGDGPFTMEPIANTYQPSAGTQLPYPAFDEDGVIGVAAAGGTFTGPFDVETVGIAPLVLEDGEALLDGSDLTLRWGAGSGSARVFVQLDISHHGGTRGLIVCDTADDGELVIAAALADALVDLGVAGFPSIQVTRESRGEVALDVGRVALTVASSVERAVTIPGLQSCNDDVDCDDGAVCRPDRTCGAP